MPGSTPVRGIPFPSPTDPINAYPALAQSAAQNLDTHTHDKGTVSSAVNADYATSAGNANTLDGLDSTAFAPASHGLHVPAYGSVVVAAGGSGTPGDTGLPGLSVACNGDSAANSNPMDFVGDTGGRLIARWLLTGVDHLSYLYPVGITNAAVRVNYVSVF